MEWLKVLFVGWGERDTECGGDNDVGAASQELSIQMVQVRTEGDLRYGVVGLATKDERTFLIIIKVEILLLLNEVLILELEGLKQVVNDRLTLSGLLRVHILLV